MLICVLILIRFRLSRFKMLYFRNKRNLLVSYIVKYGNSPCCFRKSNGQKMERELKLWNFWLHIFETNETETAKFVWTPNCLHTFDTNVYDSCDCAQCTLTKWTNLHSQQNAGKKNQQKKRNTLVIKWCTLHNNIKKSVPAQIYSIYMLSFSGHTH